MLQSPESGYAAQPLVSAPPKALLQSIGNLHKQGGELPTEVKTSNRATSLEFNQQRSLSKCDSTNVVSTNTGLPLHHDQPSAAQVSFSPMLGIKHGGHPVPTTKKSNGLGAIRSAYKNERSMQIRNSYSKYMG